MKKSEKKLLVLRLIKDDLRKWKLIYSLQSVGFLNHDFDQHIFESVLDLLGIDRSDENLDEIIPRYMNLTEKMRSIDLRFGNREMDGLALEVYWVLMAFVKKSALKKETKKATLQ